VCIQNDEPPGKRSTKKSTHQRGAAQEQSESRRSQPFPIVVVRSLDKDFPGVSQDHFIVVRPDHLIMGIFKEDKADSFVSDFQRLLYPHYE